MKNRALLLALQNEIFTIEEFAERIDITLDQATKLFYESAGVTFDTINKCCLYFNVSVPYFLCEIEQYECS